MRFDDLKLSEPVLRAVHAEGYETPTPIQAQAIPHILSGADLLGCAQTGTGKTAAFALPILCRLGTTPVLATEPIPALARHAAHHDRRHAGDTRYFAPRRVTRVLVLTPTRELAVQIGESFTTYGKFTGNRCGLVFGGVGQGNQERMLRAGVDVLVATPGRLLDLMNQGFVDLSGVEVFVLDEADRMLDMGFIHDIRRVIAKVPEKRQTLLFSATMPVEIKRLADGILRDPVHVAVAPVSSTAERVEQKVFHVEKMKKSALLMDLLDRDTAIERVLVFTRTKHGADRVSRTLNREGVSSEAIHGNKSQGQRQRALELFKKGRTRVLVATDIAARGLDIDNLTHVINFDLPNEPESYVHRIGRTGRAGASGIALSFCSGEERGFLRDIERVIGKKVPVGQTPPMLERIESPRVEEEDERPARFERPGRFERSGPPASKAPRPMRDAGTRHAGAASKFEPRDREQPRHAAPRPMERPEERRAPEKRQASPLTDPIVVKPKSPPFEYEAPAPRPAVREERPHREERTMRRKHAERYESPAREGRGSAPKTGQGFKSHGSKGFGSKPFGSKQEGAKQHGSKPHGSPKPTGDRPRHGEHPVNGRAHEHQRPAKPHGKPAAGQGFSGGGHAPRRETRDGAFGERPGFKKGAKPGFRRAGQGPSKPASGGGWKKARR